MTLDTIREVFFKYVRSKLTVRPEITEMQNENGVLADEDRDIVSIMGNYFNSVYSELIHRDIPDMNDMYETKI